MWNGFILLWARAKNTDLGENKQQHWQRRHETGFWTLPFQVVVQRAWCNVRYVQIYQIISLFPQLPQRFTSRYFPVKNHAFNLKIPMVPLYLLKLCLLSRIKKIENGSLVRNSWRHVRCYIQMGSISCVIITFADFVWDGHRK